MKPLHSIFLLFFILTFNSFAQSKLKSYETTRMTSLSGAGVGALLVNESSFLNPASIAFYNLSSFYYQRSNASIESDDSSVKNGESELLVISDTSSALKGTFTYQRQSENAQKRTRFTSSLASTIGANKSLGLIYQYTMDSNQPGPSVYHQFHFGYSHIYSPELSFGVTLHDPMSVIKEDTKITIGLNYQLFYNFFIIADAGSYYEYDDQKNDFYNYGLQLSIFSDFYFRVGQSINNFTNLKSNSWGASWVGPKLSFEYAFKNIELISTSSDTFTNNNKTNEQSFAISLRF